MKRGSWALLGLLLFGSPAAAQVAENPLVLHIPRVARPPVLEDFLEASAPRTGAVVSAFLQRAPRDGDAISQPTTAYLSYDEHNLYVVFVCQDDRGKTRARLTTRDDIAADDLVGIYLDTFHDRQRAYFFKINPLGLQADEIVTEGQDADASWDAVWYSRGRLTDDGYVVWAAIPFASFRFSNNAVQEWGVALTRYIQRNNEDSYWPYITDRLEGLVPHFATMDGLADVSSQRNLELIPHAVYTGARFLDPALAGGPAFRTNNEPNAGVDVKVVLHDSFTLDVTAKPELRLLSDAREAVLLQANRRSAGRTAPDGQSRTLGVRWTGDRRYPATVLRQSGAAFPADFSDTSLTMSFKPGHGRSSNSSYDAGLESPSPVRAIVDYNGVLPDEDLVALERAKRLTYDVLVAYLLSPGTAVHVGFTDTFENLALGDRSNELTRIISPTVSTGRQLFVKASYLFRRKNR